MDKKMRLAKTATVSNSSRLKPPYVGVTADLVQIFSTIWTVSNDELREIATAFHIHTNY